MIELASSKLKNNDETNVLFSQDDCFSSTLEKGSFQSILAFNVLHLVDEVNRTIHRLNELLEFDGLLISQTPCLDERGRISKTLINYAQKFGIAPPIQNLNYQSLQTLITEGGFKVIEKDTLDHKNRLLWMVAQKV